MKVAIVMFDGVQAHDVAGPLDIICEVCKGDTVFVEQVRVDSARKLLEDSDAPLKTVAFKCGFRSATHMRTTLSRPLEVTPKQYRQRFRGEAGKQPCADNSAGKQVSLQGLSPL